MRSSTHRSPRREEVRFLDGMDPSLRSLNHPTRLKDEVDLMAAAALLVSVASLVPVAAGAALAVALARHRH